MSMKNSSDTIGNRTSDLLACSTVPQPTAPPCAPIAKHRSNQYYELKWDFKNQWELLCNINKPSELAAEAYFILAELIAASSDFFTGQYI
jgi:hypothetical protein